MIGLPLLTVALVAGARHAHARRRCCCCSCCSSSRPPRSAARCSRSAPRSSRSSARTTTSRRRCTRSRSRSARTCSRLIVFLVVAGVVSTLRRRRRAPRPRRGARACRRRDARAARGQRAARRSARRSRRVRAVVVRARRRERARRAADGARGTPKPAAGSRPPASPADADLTLAARRGRRARARRRPAHRRRPPGAQRVRRAAHRGAASGRACRRPPRRRPSSPRPTSCAPRCSRPCRTICARRSRRSRRRRRACARPTSSGPTQDRAEFLETIEDETDRLTALVSNLLDMSRLQAGVLQPTLRPVNLEEVVPAAIASLGERAYGVVVRRARDAAARCAPTRRCSNASSPTSWRTRCGGRPAIGPARVTAGRVHDRVDLRVIDHGPGIAADSREQVFQPFQRLGDRGGSGVGLGLAVARGFVRAMEGELLIEDTPDGGTTAVVSLGDRVVSLRARGRRRAAAPARADHEPPRARLRGRRRDHRRDRARDGGAPPSRRRRARSRPARR